MKDGLPRWVMDIGAEKLDEMTEEQCENQTQAMIRTLIMTCQNLKALDIAKDTDYTIKLKLYLGKKECIHHCSTASVAFGARIHMLPVSRAVVCYCNTHADPPTFRPFRPFRPFLPPSLPP
jgi:hypothetical protein